jgi:hypothetical protein
MSTALSTGLVSVGLSLVLAGAVSAATIDSFFNGTGTLTVFNSTATGSANASQVPGGTDPLGGRRDGWVYKNSVTALAEEVKIDVADGMVSMSSEALTYATWKLEWGTGLALNADLTDGGASSLFVIDVINNASLGGSVVIDIQTGTGTLSKTVSMAASLTPYTLSIPFSSFSGSGNWGDTDKITMTVDTVAAGYDTVWTLVGTTSVPEPASLTLLGLAAMALLRRRAKN